MKYGFTGSKRSSRQLVLGSLEQTRSKLTPPAAALLETAPPMLAALLQLPESEWIASNTLAFAVRAPSPVCPGHALVALRRWTPYAEASGAERAALWALVEQVKSSLATSLQAIAFEVGFAAGHINGDAVPEAAVHVIPRSHETSDIERARAVVGFEPLSLDALTPTVDALDELRRMPGMVGCSRTAGSPGIRREWSPSTQAPRSRRFLVGGHRCVR